MKVSTEYKNYLINKLNYKAKINLKSLNCDVCGKKKYSLISNKSLLSSKKNKYIKFPYVLCNNCGHAQQFFRFNKEVYTNYYNKILEANTDRSNFYSYRLKNSILRGKVLVKFLEKKLKIKFKNHNILDIGCGHGGMLHEFYNKGCNVLGVDPDKKTINFSKKKINYIDLKVSNAEELNLKKNFYDLIIINGSLEHVQDPNVVIKKVKSFLKDKGYLFLEGKGYPLDIKENFFNFSHNRIFTDKSFTNLCSKYRIYRIDSSYTSPLNILKNKFASKAHKNFAKIKNNKGNLYWIGYKHINKKTKKIKKDLFFKKIFKL